MQGRSEKAVTKGRANDMREQLGGDIQYGRCRLIWEERVGGWVLPGGFVEHRPMEARRIARLIHFSITESIFA